MNEQAIRIGVKTWVVIVFLLLLATITSNPIPTFAGILYLPLSAKLLWRRNEPPIVFFGFLLQWVQITIKVFYADLYDIPLSEVIEFPTNIHSAYYLSLLALLAQAAGVWVVLQSVPSASKEDYSSIVKQYNLKKVMVVYIIAIILFPILVRIGFASGGFQQIIQKIADLKWALFFFFYVVTFMNESNSKKNFYIISAVEILLGFTGYFSSFKDFFFIIALGYLMIKSQFQTKQFLAFGFAGALLFNLFVIWQHVKPEYRQFLSGGESSQNVVVSGEDALGKLGELVAGMNGEGYLDGIERLVNRAAYIDYFSASIEYVPAQLDYENGKLWWSAVVHIFTPRIFFPNKPIIDDSEKTKKYTGLNLAGAAQGTSISLGYVAESYVDFGATLYVVPLFLFGVILGWVYKYLISTSPNILWGFALIVPIFFHINIFEIALDKIVGGSIAHFLVVIMIQKVALPHLDKFLKVK